MVTIETSKLIVSLIFMLMIGFNAGFSIARSITTTTHRERHTK